MIYDWNLRSRKHRTNAHLIGAISPKKRFSSIMRYIVLWRHLWRYRINANIKTWYPQKPHILTFTPIPSSFFSDHCVKLYRWMCITFQMPLVYDLPQIKGSWHAYSTNKAISVDTKVCHLHHDLLLLKLTFVDEGGICVTQTPLVDNVVCA